MHFSKKPELWQRYSACILEGLSVRAAAARVGIDKNTAWRWRHALLEGSARETRLTLCGSVETLVRPLPVYGVDAPARHANARVRIPGLWVLLARDGHRVTACHAVGRRPVRVSDYESLLATSESTMNGLVVVGGPVASAARYARLAPLAFAARRNFSSFATTTYGGPDLAPYASRLRGWLRRFRGIAAHYLSNYLHWHVLLHDVGDAAAMLLRAAQRAPPITRASGPGTER